MKVDLGIWGKLTWALIILGFMAGLGVVVDLYLPLIRQNERLRHEIEDLNTKIQKAEEDGGNYKRQIDAFHHDPRTVERLAREKNQFARPDETVIRFVESPSNNPVVR